jgi:hypothetical protein
VPKRDRYHLAIRHRSVPKGQVPFGNS